MKTALNILVALNIIGWILICIRVIYNVVKKRQHSLSVTIAGFCMVLGSAALEVAKDPTELHRFSFWGWNGLCLAVGGFTIFMWFSSRRLDRKIAAMEAHNAALDAELERLITESAVLAKMASVLDWKKFDKTGNN